MNRSEEDKALIDAEDAEVEKEIRKILGPYISVDSDLAADDKLRGTDIPPELLASMQLEQLEWELQQKKWKKKRKELK